MNTDFLLLSIITVCLNESDRIEQTAQSIVNQTCQDFEWIVIDGGSTDGTLEVLEKYRDRMQVFLSEKDGGVYHAMNKGIDLARGEYCLFMNGGDKLYDEHALKNFFDFEEKADINYGGIVEVRRSSVKIFKYAQPIMNAKDFWYRSTLPHQACFIRTNLFLSCGNYDTSYSLIADRDFFVRAFFNYNAKLQHMPFIVSFFYFDGLTAKYKKTKYFKREVKRFRNNHFGYIFSVRYYTNVFISKIIGRSI
ncbi:glycosyltransferase family 2 protein [Desulfonatronum thiodismutans]|uniref:glycosyltransferase family 2 protein n=1 Tax=Desulfonatronum thiodismutans TaxID=159290 RepID=UPI0004ABDB7F|nr:glycosyltransferase family 2 protein [Desulfonatronum thiodismutans]